MVQLKRKKKIVVNVETQGYPIERHHFLTTQRVYWRHMRTLQKTLFLNLKKKLKRNVLLLEKQLIAMNLVQVIYFMIMHILGSCRYSALMPKNVYFTFTEYGF